MIPNDDQIHNYFTDVRRSCTEKVEARVLELARRARSGDTGTDGYKSRHGAVDGGGGGGMKVLDEESGEEIMVAATSVESMALNDSQTDPLYPQFVLLFDMLSQEAMSGRAVLNTSERIVADQTPEKPIGHISKPCKSEVVGCDSPAVARGWCNACRMWIQRNPSSDGVDPLTVPAHVIDERTKRREKAS